MTIIAWQTCDLFSVLGKASDFILPGNASIYVYAFAYTICYLSLGISNYEAHAVLCQGIADLFIGSVGRNNWLWIRPCHMRCNLSAQGMQKYLRRVWPETLSALVPSRITS